MTPKSVTFCVTFKTVLVYLSKLLSIKCSHKKFGLLNEMSFCSQFGPIKAFFKYLISISKQILKFSIILSLVMITETFLMKICC